MADQKIIPVVIPYFRAPEKLERCLKQLQEQEDVRLEIFVRDNSEDNILYTKAINEGLRKFSYNDQFEYVLIITQDAYLRPSCLKNLIKAMEFDPKCGIVAPAHVDANDHIAWMGSLQAFPWGVHRLDGKLGLPIPINTYWANGACMLVRTSMVREIGLMDENMLFIASDSDYSFTARARGWHVLVAPDAIIEHSLDASGAAAKPNPMINQTKVKDVIYFAKKWANGDLLRELSFAPDELTSENIQRHVNNLQGGLK